MGFRSAFINLAQASKNISGPLFPIKTQSSCPSAASTMLHVKPILKDFSAETIGFFTSIRIPAALIAGSSLGAMFVMLQQHRKEDSITKKRTMIVIFVYHALILFSLLLSLNVIVTATSASNSMLIANNIRNTVAGSPYEVLIREMNFEYLTTRWSFYTSLLCFLKAVLCRGLIEFDLLKRESIKPALLLTFSVTTLSSHILHVVNDCLYSYPNFFEMTIGVFKLYLERAWVQRNSMLLLSFFSAGAAVATLISMFPNLKEFLEARPQEADSEKP